MDILVANDVCIIQENMDIIRSSKSQETKASRRNLLREMGIPMR